MAKLSDERLYELKAAANEQGKETFEIMTNEELKAYRNNCLEGLEFCERMVSKTKGARAEWNRQGAEEMKEMIAYIDNKLANEESGNALDQFLAQWKTVAAEYYWNLKNEMQEVKNADYEINEENLKSIISSTMGKRQYSDTKIEKMLNSELPSYQVRNLKIEIAHSKYNEWVSGKTLADVNFVKLLDTKEDLNNALDSIVKEKKYNFMARVQKKAGEILDMSGLTLGHDGSINGTVIGKEKTVTVKTVFAGGHNVQCLHYRVMVK